MGPRIGIRFQNIIEFWDHLPENERDIVDVLRQLILDILPKTCREKLAYNVPCYYGKKRICIVWPASIPGGGIKKGVLLGFCQGYKLKDVNGYLIHGTNKRIFYKIYQSVEEINTSEIILLLKEAIALDNNS